MQKKNTPFTGYNPDLKENASQLRKNMTKQEKHLWYDFLRTYPVKFYRQRPIDRFIADFYCSQAKLVIEIDGSQHYTEQGLAYDKERTDILAQYGLAVLRFTNAEIDRSFQGVCTAIDMKVKERINGQTNR